MSARWKPSVKHQGGSRLLMHGIRRIDQLGLVPRR
jgi:hypothetical protein